MLLFVSRIKRAKVQLFFDITKSVCCPYYATASKLHIIPQTPRSLQPIPGDADALVRGQFGTNWMNLQCLWGREA